MKRLLLMIILLLGYSGYAQVYIPMPADSTSWRYRIYDIDYITQVMDFCLFIDGTDTVANGHTYHKIRSRVYQRVVPNGSVPPVIDVIANHPDINYGGIRESDKQVFLLTLSGEQLIYDFNAGVGDSIPSYLGKKKVTDIDSVFLGSVYHKRFLTNDPAYYVIEGVGSSIGLIPDLNDGAGTVQYMCFRHTMDTYSPDPSVPCTFVYPIEHMLLPHPSITNTGIDIFPVPAHDMLYLVSSMNTISEISIYNMAGNIMWTDYIDKKLDIRIASWPDGIYYIHICNAQSGCVTKKVIIQ